jgi:hypothetical protein
VQNRGILSHLFHVSIMYSIFEDVLRSQYFLSLHVHRCKNAINCMLHEPAFHPRVPHLLFVSALATSDPTASFAITYILLLESGQRAAISLEKVAYFVSPNAGLHKNVSCVWGGHKMYPYISRGL